MREQINIGDIVYHRYKTRGIGRVVHISFLWCEHYRDSLSITYMYIVRWNCGNDDTCRESEIEKVPQDTIEFINKIKDRIDDVGQI